MALHSHSCEAIPPWDMERFISTYPFPANEPPKGEGVCRDIGYTAHEMCTMWLSSAVVILEFSLCKHRQSLHNTRLQCGSF